MKCTLVVFTMSYFVVVVRSFTIFAIIQADRGQLKIWVCKNNFIVNLINVISYVLIDLVPIGTIFYLHWKNFREEAQKQYMLDKMQENADSLTKDDSGDASQNK